jgi:glycosyltransferase involved in cell wall biosynthesis
VVIPAHNAERYLAETLESVRAQTFSDYEILVIDDGSTDRTAEIAAGYSGVTLLSQNNRGAAAARNAGIRTARGQFVAFLDADDIWVPSKLEKQAANLLRNPQTAWIYSDALVFDGSAGLAGRRIGKRIRLYEGDIWRPLLLRNFIASATPVVIRTALIEAGLFDESRERNVIEDWTLWLRIAERHPITLIDEPLARIRMHANNSSRKADPGVMYRNKRALLDHAMARNPGAGSCLRLRAQANIAMSAGLRYVRNTVRPRGQGGS